VVEAALKHDDQRPKAETFSAIAGFSADRIERALPDR